MATGELYIRPIAEPIPPPKAPSPVRREVPITSPAEVLIEAQPEVATVGESLMETAWQKAGPLLTDELGAAGNIPEEAERVEVIELLSFAKTVRPNTEVKPGEENVPKAITEETTGFDLTIKLLQERLKRLKPDESLSEEAKRAALTPDVQAKIVETEKVLSELRAAKLTTETEQQAVEKGLIKKEDINREIEEGLKAIERGEVPSEEVLTKAYEKVIGKPPEKGATPQQMLEAIITKHNPNTKEGRLSLFKTVGIFGLFAILCTMGLSSISKSLEEGMRH